MVRITLVFLVLYVIVPLNVNIISFVRSLFILFCEMRVSKCLTRNRDLRDRRILEFGMS